MRDTAIVLVGLAAMVSSVACKQDARPALRPEAVAPLLGDDLAYSFEIGTAPRDPKFDGELRYAYSAPDVVVVKAEPMGGAACKPEDLTSLAQRIEEVSLDAGCGGLLGCVRIFCQSETGFMAAMGADGKGVAWSAGEGRLPAEALGSNLSKVGAAP